MTAAFPVRAVRDGVEFAVLAAPRSAQAGVRGIQAEALKVAVHAAPGRGKANDELVLVLAGFLGVKPGTVAIASGAGSRHKRVRVTGVSSETIIRAVGRI